MLNEKGIKVGIIALGILDIIFGLCMLLTIIFLAWFSSVLGILYLFFGFGIILKSLKIKLLYFGIIPFTIFCLVVIWMMAVIKDTPAAYKLSVSMGAILSGILLSFCLANIYFFTRPTVKTKFRTQTFIQKIIIYLIKGLIFLFIAFVFCFLGRIVPKTASLFGILFLIVSIFFVILALYNIFYLSAKEIIRRKKVYQKDPNTAGTRAGTRRFI